MEKLVNIPDLIEENLAGLYSLAALAGNLPAAHENGFSWVNASPHVWPSYIYNARFSKHEATERIETIVRLIDRCEAPPFWITGPKLQINDLPEILSSHSFRLMMQWPGMAMDPGECATLELYKDLTIIEANHTSQLREWIALTSHNLFKGKPQNDEMFQNMLGTGHVKFLMGYEKEQAVASLMMYIYEGVAGFYMISTHPGWRNKGIGRTMVRRGLEIAQEKNCSLCVLQANAMSYDLYKSIGFKEYGTFNIFWNLNLPILPEKEG
jgi:ribosomal protein S18 acetylase RimI-like enzyme